MFVFSLYFMSLQPTCTHSQIYILFESRMLKTPRVRTLALVLTKKIRIKTTESVSDGSRLKFLVGSIFWI